MVMVMVMATAPAMAKTDRAEDVNAVGRSSPVRKGLGGVLGLASLWAAYHGWDEAQFNHLRSINVLAAHAARPTDATALAGAVESKMQVQANIGTSDRELRAALIRTPMSRALLRIVGMKAELNGKAARADQAMRLSNALSRRDAIVQLWLIEQSVSKNDMQAALSHYHAALSVHPRLGQALFPVLSKAIAFPEVRAGLISYFGQEAPWTASLLNYAIEEGDATNTALLVMSVGKVIQTEAYEKPNAHLLSKLAEAGRFDLAYKLAKMVVPRFDPGKAGALAVNERTTDPRLGSLAWILANEGPVLTSANESGGFDVQIQPLSYGTAAARNIALREGGVYSFSQAVRSDGSAPAPHLVWKAACLPDAAGKAFWEQSFPARRDLQRYDFMLSIPTGCRGIHLVLETRGPDGQQPAEVKFEHLNFRPLEN